RGGPVRAEIESGAPKRGVGKVAADDRLGVVFPAATFAALTLLSCRRFFLCVRRGAALGRRAAHCADVIMSGLLDLQLRGNERPLPPEIPSPPTMVPVRPVTDDALDKQRLRTDGGLVLNVCDRLVVRGQRHRSGHRLAGRIGYGHFDGAVFAGPMYLL